MKSLEITLTDHFKTYTSVFMADRESKYYYLITRNDKRDLSLEEIDREIYMQNKFGINTKAILSQFNYPEKLIVTHTDHSMLVTAFDIEPLYEYDLKGELIKEYKILDKEAVYSIQYSNNQLWVAYPSISDITCYDLEKEVEVYSLKEDQVSYPEHLLIKDNWLYISEMGNKCISRVNLDSKEKQSYKQLEEGPFGFYKLDNIEVTLYPGKLIFEEINI